MIHLVLFCKQNATIASYLRPYKQSSFHYWAPDDTDSYMGAARGVPVPGTQLVIFPSTIGHLNPIESCVGCPWRGSRFGGAAAVWGPAAVWGVVVIEMVWVVACCAAIAEVEKVWLVACSAVAARTASLGGWRQGE
jgi:hypothetical protein